MPTLAQQRDEKLDAAQRIVDGAKAAGRTIITDDELARVNALLDEATKLSDQLDHAQKSQAALKRLGAVSGRTSPDGSTPYGSTISAPGPLKHMPGLISGKIRDYLAKADTDGGPITPGNLVVPIDQFDVIIPEPGPNLSLLDSFSITTRASVYEYGRQVGRANNADLHETYDELNESGFDIFKVEDRLREIGHVSKMTDVYMLQDSASLNAFVGQDLLRGVSEKLEQQLINGDGTGTGTGQQMVGLTNTSGIQVVAPTNTSNDFGTALLGNLRTAITALDDVTFAPSVFLVSSADWTVVETTTDANGSFIFGPPSTAVARQAWGVPVVATPALASGTSFLVGQQAAVIASDSRLGVEWLVADGDFKRHTMRARVIGRWNLDVVAPAGIVKVTTTVE